MEVKTTPVATWVLMAAQLARLEHFYLVLPARGVRPHPPSAIRMHSFPSQRNQGLMEQQRMSLTVFTAVRMLEVAVTNTLPVTIHPASALALAEALTE